MDVEAGTSCQPGAHLGVFMSGVVIDDEMDIEVCGDTGIQIAQEGKELLVAMARLAFGEPWRGSWWRSATASCSSTR